MKSKQRQKKSEVRAADLIREGLEEAVAFVRGEQTGARVHRVPITARRAMASPPPTLERSQIIDLRTKLGVSQTVFANALNVSPETVRAWEQGRNTPGGPALRLLEIAETRPAVILEKVAAKRMFVGASMLNSSGEKSRKRLAARRNPGATKRMVAATKSTKGTRKK